MDAEIENRKMEAPECDFFGFRVDFSGFWGVLGELKNEEKIDPRKILKEKKVRRYLPFSPGL